MASFPKKPVSVAKATPARAPFVAAAAPVAAPKVAVAVAPPSPKAVAAPVALKVAEAIVAAAPAVVSPKPAPAAATAEVPNMQESVRKAAVNGVEQSRAAYERVKASAENVNTTLEASFASATKGVNEINAKAFDALRANSEAVFDLFKALLAVKSVDEAFSLHAEHGRKQFETVSAQTREIAELAQKLATQSVEPIKASLNKAFATSH